MKKPHMQPVRAISFFTLFLLLGLNTGSAQVRGLVFRDFNGNGSRDSASIGYEPGFGGLEVFAYSGMTSVSTVTDSSGYFSFPDSGLTSAGYPLRIQFGSLPSYLYAGSAGGSGTSVQFVTAGPGVMVTYSVQDPAEYCSPSPQVMTSCFVAGNPDAGSQAGQREVLIGLDFNAMDSPPHTTLALAEEMGSVWGLIFQRSEKKIFSAAFMKRHVGFGPGGPGAIYVTQLSQDLQSPVSTDLFFDFGLSAGPDPHDADLPNSSLFASRDNGAYDAVGKVGLGGLTLSTDEQILYTINLHNRRLYQITLATKDTISYAVPDPGCNLGPFRPFAVKYYRNKVYVGGVCTNEEAVLPTDTTGFAAAVFVFQNGVFTPVLNFPLTYKKQASSSDFEGVARAEYWRPWTSIYRADRETGSEDRVVIYPQPWLTDITFDVDGAMILGIRDRYGDQMGYKNYKPFDESSFDLYSAISPGEILKAGLCTPGLWTIEQNGAVCGGTPSASQTAQEGPGGGKYFYGDQVAQGLNHGLSSMGGLSHWPGSGKVIMTAIDPTDELNTGGLKRLLTRDGGPDNGGGPAGGALLYREGALSYGKANGLGDVELLCEAAPIEIGNRAWFDSNQNGLQDSGEPSIADLEIQLYQGSELLASATTDEKGEYYFSTATGAQTTSRRMGLNLRPGTTYSLVIPMNQSATENLKASPADLLSNGRDMIDNDFNQTGSQLVLTFTLGKAGENNHSFDAGFALLCDSPICIPYSVRKIPAQ